MPQIIDFIIHIDQHMIQIVNQFDSFTYLILFILVFIETGIVILPFLPGDSLLFAASALAANQAFGLNIWLLMITFFIAAVLGDTLNYEIGKHTSSLIGKNSFLGKLINEEKLLKAQAFFDKHGGKTIVIARFMPFIRTFAPFVSGGSRMNYQKFVSYNVLGGFLWVILCCTTGYLFGNLPIVQENFTFVILGIIGISLLPALITYLRNKLPANIEPDE